MTTESQPAEKTIYPLEPETIDRDVAIKIHNAIHDPYVVSIKLPNENEVEIPYVVTRASNGCRQLVYNKIRFIEQNKNKITAYAELARKGHKITWGIREKKWIYILDSKIL